MIKNIDLVDNEITLNGFKECIMSIIKFYNVTTTLPNIQYINQLCDSKCNYDSIELILSNFNLKPIFCQDISIVELKKYKEPILLEIKDLKENNNFKLITKHQDSLGFLIEDSLIGDYYVSENELESIWKEKNCMIFISCFKKQLSL